MMAVVFIGDPEVSVSGLGLLAIVETGLIPALVVEISSEAVRVDVSVVVGESMDVADEDAVGVTELSNELEVIEVAGIRLRVEKL